MKIRSIIYVLLIISFFLNVEFMYGQDDYVDSITEAKKSGSKHSNTELESEEAAIGKTINWENFEPMPLPQWKPAKKEFSLTDNKIVSYNLQDGTEIYFEIPIYEPDADANSTQGYKYIFKDQLKVKEEDSPLDFSDLQLILNPEDYPWRVNVKLYMTFPSGNYVGSGVLIDGMHVLTAGHCVYEHEGSGSWASSIRIVPAYEDGTEHYGDAYAVTMYSWTGWTSSQNYDWDMGIIKLDRPVGSLTGWHGYGYNNDDIFFSNNVFNNPGYPAESPYDGQFMYNWGGSYDNVYTHILYHDNYVYGGQSGSGSYFNDGENRTVYAVVSHRISGPEAGHTRINSDKFSSIQSTISNNTPSEVDLVPLNVTVEPSTVTAGEQLTSMTYFIHNNSSVTWNGTVEVDVYISTNDNISTGDEQLQTRSFTGTINPKSSVRITASDPLPTIPTNKDGDYWIGIILDISDFDTGNNDTDGWDAAPIHVDPIPEITVTSPNGGEIWYKNIAYDITWDDNISENVRIELFAGDSFDRTITSSTASDGLYSWSIPGDVTSADWYSVKIISVDNSSISDLSNGAFTITEVPYIIVTSPVNGDIWYKNNTYNITWDDNISENVQIELFIGETFIRTIASGTESDGVYEWTIPDDVSISDGYSIYIISTENSSISDFSSGDFSILNAIPYSDDFNDNDLNVTFWTEIETMAGVTVDETGSEVLITGTSNNTAWQKCGLHTPNFSEQDLYVNVDVKIPNLTDLQSHASIRLNFVDIGGYFAASYNDNSNGYEVHYRDPDFYSVGFIPAFGDENTTFHKLTIVYQAASQTCWGYVDGQLIATVTNAAFGGLMYLQIHHESGIEGSFDVDTRFDTFNLDNEGIEVTSPNGGEVWYVGSSYDIEWISERTGNVKIEYILDEGSSWTFITPDTPDDGSYSWTIPNTPSTTCLLRITDTDDSHYDRSDGEFTITEGEQHFTWTVTESYYPIVLNSVTLDGQPIENGDEVGVFFRDDNSDLACGGGIVWDNTGLQAWEDDPQTSEKDGFESGEDLVYRLWDASAQEEFHFFDASYLVGDGQWGTGTYAQVDLAFITSRTLTIDLGQNWNWISSNVYPPEPDMDAVWSGVTDLEISKGYNGFYIPGVINSIGDWDIKQMYTAYLTNASTLEIEGEPADPQLPIELQQNWNWISYLPDNNIDAEPALASIADYLNIAKAYDGFYIPGVINNIGDMVPGKGYKAHVTQVCTLTYPTGSIKAGATVLAKTAEVESETCSHFVDYQLTEDYHPLIVQEIKGIEGEIESGDELGIYSESGLCVGAAVLQERYPQGLMAWMDDSRTDIIDGGEPGEKMELRLWKASTDTEYRVEMEVLTGSEYIGKSPFTEVSLEVDFKSAVSSIPTSYALDQNYPNPFNPVTTIRYSILDPGNVSLVIYDINGQLIKRLITGTKGTGFHQVVWDGSNEMGSIVASGVYIYIIEAGPFIQTKKMLLIK